MEHLDTRVAESLKAMLDEAGITVRVAAARTGIPLTTLHRKIVGPRRTSLTVTELADLAALLGVDASKIVARAEAAA